METRRTRTGIDITHAEIRDLATPLTNDASLDPLLASIGDARFVLLGEASHGTAEYYRWRAALTQRLIAEHDFSFVGVEGDWPDCFRVSRWVKEQAEQDRSARDVLSEFDRWPTWMWANDEVADFVSWLRTYNAETGRAVSMDLTSIHCGNRCMRYSTISKCITRTPSRLRVKRCSALNPMGKIRKLMRGAAAFPGGLRGRRGGVVTPGSLPGRNARRGSGSRTRRGSERRSRGGRRALLPDDGARQSRLVECARCPHGRHAGSADAGARSPSEGHRLGAQQHR